MHFQVASRWLSAAESDNDATSLEEQSVEQNLPRSTRGDKLAASYSVASASSAFGKLLFLIACALCAILVSSPLLLPLIIAFLFWRLLPARIRNAIKRRLSVSLISFRNENGLTRSSRKARISRNETHLIGLINERRILAFGLPSAFLAGQKHKGAHDSRCT